MTSTTLISQLPSGQAIKPASGTLTLDGTIIGSTDKQAATFTTVSATSVTSPLGAFTVVSAATPITGSSGGTGNAFMTFAGPATALKTYTLPNATTTILTTNSAVTVAQGGTGLATLTANNVILGNGASNPTFVAPGTSGNVLTSNGTTWASAAAAGGSGSMVLLSTQAASTSTNINFDSTLITSTYKQYIIEIIDMIPSTSASPVVTFSKDNGSNMLGSGYAYSLTGTVTTATAITTGSASASNITLENQGINSSFACSIKVYNPLGTTVSKKIIWQAASDTSGVSYVNTLGTGYYKADTAAINYIRIAMTSGTITSGTFKLYGIS